eukprot:scaffold12630_cov71-Phaeocystis_antarctica.AAC.12
MGGSSAAAPRLERRPAALGGREWRRTGSCSVACTASSACGRELGRATHPTSAMNMSAVASIRAERAVHSAVGRHGIAGFIASRKLEITRSSSAAVPQNPAALAGECRAVRRTKRRRGSAPVRTARGTLVRVRNRQAQTERRRLWLLSG